MNVVGGNMYANEKRWTWVYKKKFTQDEMIENSTKKTIGFSQYAIPNFSQLIFSWNAARPAGGHFSFYVKTRNASTGRWSKWHKMVDWGVDIQQSYFSRDLDTKYVYVRLETGLHHLANAFKIKVEPYGNGDLGLVHGLAVSASDFTKFYAHPVSKHVLSLKSVHIKKVPKISQRLLNHPETHRICSPTSCSILAGYFNGYAIDAAQFADHVFDYGLGVYGSWPFNIAALHNACDNNLFFYTARCNSFLDLYEHLKRKIPVVVSVRGQIEGAPKAYKSGHLMVVVGWDAKRKMVICHDPAFYADKDTFVKYNIGSFLKAWDNSNRLAYVTEKCGDTF
ncbi:C39 family peptidase [Candidatus Dependentiae bacterium]